MLRLYFNQHWGSVRTESRSYAADEGAVIAGTDEKASFPLFGFQLPAESYPIAEWDGPRARIFPPPAARLERSHRGAAFRPLADGDVQKADGRRCVVLEPGQTLRMVEGDQALCITLDEQRERAGWDKQKAAFWLLFLLIATIGGPLVFMLAGPDPTLVTRALEQARIKQGLPAKHEPIDIKVPDADEPGAEVHPGGIVLPASVR